MSISGIQGSTFNPYQLAISNPLQQQVQQLGQALQSGNLSAAQSDFATVQQTFSQQTTTTTSGVTSNPANQAFNQLASDLQSGNLSAAQKDFSAVQQDIKNQFIGPASHFHQPNDPRKEGDTNLPPGLNQNGPSPTSNNNLASAQQVYASLTQELQQFALSGGALSSLSPVSFDA